METARLTELRLTRFKSFRNAVVPLGEMTLLTGRNSSGKSNVLDALDVLSRLATPERLRDSLDGRRREGGPVRGGSRGLAPHGESSFALGCTVRVNGEAGAVDYLYDIEVEVEPEPRVSGETIRLCDTDQQGAASLFTARPSDDPEKLILAVGPLQALTLPRSSTALSFLGGVEFISRDPRSAKAADVVVQTLRSAVILNADATSMRDYVSQGRREIEPDMANLSALAHLMKTEFPILFGRMEMLAREVAGCPVQSLDFVTADDGRDVLLALKESETARTDARSMSDGLLRFLAIAAALLFAPQSAQGELGGNGQSPAVRVLAIEEIENGLHPSHAARLFELIEEAAAQAGVSIIITTHSPALLDAVGGEHAKDVLVCHDGQVTRLPDLPGYDRAMARGTLGRVVSQGLLTGPAEDETADYSDFLRLVGAL